MLRIGIDIGGTFTDVTGINEASGEAFDLKFLTSVSDPGQAVLQALDAAGIRLADVDFFSHGTTIGINMIIERKGARTGIVTTRGFRDVLELRRGSRTHLLDPLMEKPYLFIPRRWRAEVPERVAWNGDALEPLDEPAFLAAVARLSESGVESLAICFLHSYANPEHERTAGALLGERFPGIYHTLSSGIDAEIGEYERTSTAALNAYIHPGVYGYLSKLEPSLRERGLSVDFHVMQSNGGIMSSSEAAQCPIRMLESGPAAGSVAATQLGALLGLPNLISFDVGGTTAKVSVVEQGRPLSTVEFEIFEDPGHPGSGWPIRVPMIDIIEAGAGGGSIAWVDKGGELTVGPRSAGAEPGPVCYDRGGTEPTVTDANAAIGRISALLGGGFRLNIDKARKAIEETLARPLGLAIEETAAGILEINDARAADLLREVTIARGRDPRDFTLVAFGGAGPMAAAYVMRHAGMTQVVIPPMAGNFSALGLLLADLIHDGVRSHISLLDVADPRQIEHIYAEMEHDFVERLLSEGMDRTRILVERSADLRYRGQFHVINIGLAGGLTNESVLTAAVQDFHSAHLRLYMYQSLQDPIELVNLRVRVVGRVQRPSFKAVRGGSTTEALVGTRSVYFREAGRWLPCNVYNRKLLGRDSVVDGPAVIEEVTSTSLIPPEFQGTVDMYGNLVIASAS